MARRAVVLLSGGLDSTTCLAIAAAGGFDLIAVSFDYGQRHQIELEAAKKVAAHYGVAKHYVFEIGGLREIGGSALTSEIEVPEARSVAEIGQGIPVTYVPARNLIFLAHATAVAEVWGSSDVFIGVNALDYSGYPDCRPAFIEAFCRAANLGTKAGVEGAELVIHTPLIALSKADIIKKGLELGVPYGLTMSCYQPATDGVACGRCDACLLRLRGFEDAGARDPVSYES